MRKFIPWLVGVIILFFSPILTRAAVVFTISNPTVSSTDLVEVDASISGLISTSCSTTGCYLQGRLVGSKDHFGFTVNNTSELIDYIASPTLNQISTFYNIIPDSSGSWSGKLQIKNNPASSNYTGPGTYRVDFNRYSGKSTSPSGTSNSLQIELSDSKPTESPTSTPVPTPSPSPSEIPTEAPTATPIPTVIPTASPSPSPSPTEAPTPTASPTDTPTPSPLATIEPTEPPTATPTSMPTETPTITPSPTPTPNKLPVFRCKISYIRIDLGLFYFNMPLFMCGFNL